MTRKFSGDNVVLATHNTGKAAEIIAFFEPLDLRVQTLADFNLPAPDETGTTFLENASIKALAAAHASGLPALADDSGFCVAALNDAPGVYTADWAMLPDGTRDYKIAFQKIHTLLAGNPDTSAVFVATIVLAWPDGHIEYTQGRVEGAFVFPARGDKGFGYDPCFIPQGQTQTFAELGPDFKKTCSHRARAMEAMVAKCFR